PTPERSPRVGPSRRRRPVPPPPGRPVANRGPRQLRGSPMPDAAAVVRPVRSWARSDPAPDNNSDCNCGDLKTDERTRGCAPPGLGRDRVGGDVALRDLFELRLAELVDGRVLHPRLQLRSLGE